MEGFLNRFQLEGLDNCLNFLHVRLPKLQTVAGFLMFADIQASHFFLR